MLARAGAALALEMPEDSGLAGAWEPGLSEPEVGFGHRRFACKECWQVRNITLTDHSGWNDFVTHISGGLLYGQEVERPLTEAPLHRKRRPHNRPRPKPMADGLARSVAAR